MSRSVFPLPLLICRRSTVFFIDSETNETISSQFPRCYDTSNQKPQRCVSFAPKFPPLIGACSLQCPLQCHFADIRREKFFSKSFSRKNWNVFSHVKNHRSRFLLEVSFFSRVKAIVRYSDLLELVYVWKFTT